VASSPTPTSAPSEVATAAAPAASSPTTPKAAAPAVTPASTQKKPEPPPITSVRLYVSNECPKKVDYCVADGSTLNTFLSGNASTTHTVKPGAKIMLKSGSSCGAPVFTVPATSPEGKFVLCKR